MKAFITLAVVCLVANALATPLELTDEQRAKAKVHIEECIKQENINEEEATKLRNKDYSDPSQSMKCFSKCFFEKAGVMKDDVIQDKVVLEKLGPQYGEEKITAALAKCKEVKGADSCDTSYQIYECFEQAKSEKAEEATH